MRNVIPVLFIVAVAVSVVFCFIRMGRKQIPVSLTERLSRIAEMSTLRYDYKVSKAYQGKPITWYRIPIKGTEDVVIVTFPGTIKFGLNLKDVKIIEPAETDVSKVIKVIIPHASILSHEIHFQQMEEPITVKKSKLSGFNCSDFISHTKELQNEFENRAKEKGLFDEADSSAVEQITNSLLPLLKEGESVEVLFESITG